jgi:hypothetical protein
MRHAGTVGLLMNSSDCCTNPTSDGIAAATTTIDVIARQRSFTVRSSSANDNVPASAPSTHTGVAKRFCAIQSGTITPKAITPSTNGVSNATSDRRHGAFVSAHPITATSTTTAATPA